MATQKNTFFKYGDIHWSLPMLFQYEPLYAVMYRNALEHGIDLPQAYLFGCPACAWSGGRPPIANQPLSRDQIFKVMRYVLQCNALPTFTFTNTSLTKADLRDPYTNLLLDVALECGARFIVYSDMLRDYIKSKKSDAIVVASVIKPAFQFQGPNKVQKPTPENEAAYYNKLLKEYDIVVVRPEFSKGPLLKDPSIIDDISRVEVLINQTCINECPRMPDHYRFFDTLRMGRPAGPQPPPPLNGPGAVQNQNPHGPQGPGQMPPPQGFQCIKASMARNAALTNFTAHTEKQVKTLVKAGVQHLKLQGRSDGFIPPSFIMLLASQMFNCDGPNYSIFCGLTRREAIDGETARFNQEIFAPPQSQPTWPSEPIPRRM